MPERLLPETTPVLERKQRRMTLLKRDHPFSHDRACRRQMTSLVRFVGSVYLYGFWQDLEGIESMLVDVPKHESDLDILSRSSPLLIELSFWNFVWLAIVLICLLSSLRRFLNSGFRSRRTSESCWLIATSLFIWLLMPLLDGRRMLFN